MVFRVLYGSNEELNRIQMEVQKELLRLQTEAIIIKQTITIGMVVGNNAIYHNLITPPAGFIIIDQDAASNFYTVSKDQYKIVINSSAATKVTLYLC